MSENGFYVICAPRAAVCAAHVALDDAPCPGSRIAAGAKSEPGGLGSREGSEVGGSTTLGSFRGFWIPPVWGRVMRTGVDVAYGPIQVLKLADRLLLETSLFQSFLGGKQLHDVISFMHEQGFVTYDLLGYIYRLLDGALAQMDLAFAKEEGLFRLHHVYASPPQRAAQNELFQARQREHPGSAVQS